MTTIPQIPSPPPCPRCAHRHPAGERCQALPPGAYWTQDAVGAWYVARVAVVARRGGKQ